MGLKRTMAHAPGPIDLEDETEVQQGLTHALVAVGGDSPTKRAKTMALASSSSIDQMELVNLIQSTIQEFVHTSLLPMQSTVQALTDKSIIQDKPWSI